MCETLPAEDRDERLIQTLVSMAFTLSDFRVRLEALERTRWQRFKDWWRANVYDGMLVYEDETREY